LIIGWIEKRKSSLVRFQRGTCRTRAHRYKKIIRKIANRGIEKQKSSRTAKRIQISRIRITCARGMGTTFTMNLKSNEMRKTILITGASSGLGKETAKFFQQQGWNVIATMRNPENETELTTLANVLVAKIDVLDIESIARGVSAGIEKFGKIDVLLNNAGYGAYGPLESFSRDKIIRQFNTNVIGLLDVTKALLPHFRLNKSGVIINISSIGGKMAFPLGTLYHGTKFAVEGISESLKYEVAAFGVKVKIIEPGAILTDFTGRSLDFSNDEMLREYQPLIGKVISSMEALFQNASPASVIAEVIYRAANDDKDQLRYAAGEDAKMMVAVRKQHDDELFMTGIKAQFGI
jgi:NADP-dependent 3-hydroxy acid dehydrogenase YdfG